MSSFTSTLSYGPSRRVGRKIKQRPWQVWLRRDSVSLCSERLRVGFPVKAMYWAVGWLCSIEGGVL